MSTAFVPAAQARHYQVLHGFSGNDGSGPSGNLQIDGAGNLYGTTLLGGDFGHGTIFKLSPAGDFTLLYSFAAGSDGSQPGAGLTIDPTTGDLYGTTTEGGAHGWGGVFKLTSAGTLTVLHDFSPAADGSFPSAAMTRDSQGNFYGTTYQDGAHGNGTIFELAANGSFQVLHALAASEGDSRSPVSRSTARTSTAPRPSAAAAAARYSSSRSAERSPRSRPRISGRAWTAEWRATGRAIFMAGTPTVRTASSMC